MVKMNSAHQEDPFASLLDTSTSQTYLDAIDMARKLAGIGSTVLLTGETGVGKERFAQAIHRLREREDAPFIAVNCGALMASLVESELFGYEKGAFSGADARGKPGKIELARGGTLFLDEIGELSSELQVKLLRVLEERSYYPVGGTRSADVDCRFVAATNRDLEARIRDGRFREDLYYRLNAIAIDIPPLRSRKEDIPLLSRAFLREFSERYHRPVADFGPNVTEALSAHDWPGNVRELRNAIERIVVFSQNGEARLSDLPASLRDFMPIASRDQPTSGFNNSNVSLPTFGSLPEWLARREREYIDAALEQCGGNKVAAAKRLGISRVSLYKKLGTSANVVPTRQL
ncbi:sigma-54 interaction domain-containing protein [Cohnella herbarum]|uniref:Sigma 54-interacting transcriptional regulator n=1 Tax=Cohnella herbarum TaxID=2728023 RepID=A0A7Z2ZPT3_9BACL|nr:sigma 54-interacting transcriptional regulator [Cohnella herbarum]QJD87816.1 sigma 54-interacting transcriptional regulator [Cohnella herbarum]